MVAHESTRILLRRAQAGDRNAFEELARRYRRDLLAWVTSRMGPVVKGQLDPEDLVQETILKAYAGLDRFQWQGDDSLRNWLRAIAEHLIRNASRKRSATMQKLMIEPSTKGPSPSRIARRNERFDRLQEALLALSLDHRKVIELARLEGLKIHEIAERMQRSPGAVKQLLSRALDQLKERFGDTASLHLPNRLLDMTKNENV